jgi:hypothetical protein
MLEKYLPTLPVKLKINDKVCIPETVLETLKETVCRRNWAAHKGAKVFHDQSLERSLKSIQATLYLLDYYAGHAWAVHNIRDPDAYEFLAKEFNAAKERAPQRPTVETNPPSGTAPENR